MTWSARLRRRRAHANAGSTPTSTRSSWARPRHRKTMRSATSPMKASATEVELSVERLVLHSGIRELVREVVEPGCLQRHRHRAAGLVLPVPPVDAGERSDERAGCFRRVVALLVRLRVAAWRAIGLGVKLEVHRGGSLPRVQQCLPLLQAVLVFDSLAGLEGEALGVAHERTRLRNNDFALRA